MTKLHAIAQALRHAKRTGRTQFIVWSVEDHDEPRDHYHHSTQTDLETFYLGADPVCSVDPDGMVSE